MWVRGRRPWLLLWWRFHPNARVHVHAGGDFIPVCACMHAYMHTYTHTHTPQRNNAPRADEEDDDEAHRALEEGKDVIDDGPPLGGALHLSCRGGVKRPSGVGWCSASVCFVLFWKGGEGGGSCPSCVSTKRKKTHRIPSHPIPSNPRACLVEMEACHSPYQLSTHAKTPHPTTKKVKTPHPITPNPRACLVQHTHTKQHTTKTPRAL